MAVNRYQQDLAALAPSHQLSLLSLAGIDRRFGNGYLQTWTLGLERVFGGLTADVAYVGTSAFRLPRMSESASRSEEHTSELQSRLHLVCRLLLEKKKKENASCMTSHRTHRLIGMSLM